MRSGRTIAAVAVFALVPGIAAAQSQPPAATTLTLAQAVARVQTAGFDVRAARADAEIASADARTARAASRPQIGVSIIGLNANEPQLGMPVASQAYGAASLTLPLFTPSTRASAAAARFSERAAAIGSDASASDAVLATIRAYRRAQLAAAVLDARDLALRDQQEHLRLTTLRVASGKLPRYTLLRDRANVALAEQSAEDAAAERDQARNDLTSMLDLGIVTDAALDPLLPLSFGESEDAVARRALSRRPSLRAAEQCVDAAAQSVAAARGAYLPSAQLTAQSYNGASSPYLGHGGGQVQIAATLPIVDGGSRSAAVTRAVAELARATALRDQVRAEVERDVADAYREFTAARRNLSTSQAVANDADEQLRISRIRERAGKGIDLEVLDSLALAANARETVLRSLARYDISIAAVHHAAGDASS